MTPSASAQAAPGATTDSALLVPLDLEPTALDLSGPARPRTYLAAVGRRAIAVGTEQGGFEVWSWPLKLLHGFDLHFKTAPSDETIAGRSVATRVEITPAGSTISYTHPAFTVRQHLFAALNEPAVVMVLDVDAMRPLEISADFVPDLTLAWPGASGGQYIAWDETAHAFLLSESLRGLNALVGSPFISDASNEPVRDAPDEPNRFRIQLGEKQLHPRGIPIVIVGGALPRDSVRSIYQRVLAGIPALYRERAAHAQAVLDSALWIESPDPRLDLATRWAALNLDEALACNPDLGCGLVAGYGPSGPRGTRPGFAWFFGGDAAVNSLGLSASGQFEDARQGLEFFLRYQRSDGKIPHEISQSAGHLKWFEDFPYAFYHADTTPYWILAWGDYWRATADTTTLRRVWPAIKRAFDWCRTTVDSSSGLMLNSKGGLGAVEVGDLGVGLKADIYLSAIWIQALGRMAEMSEWAERSGKAGKAGKNTKPRTVEPRPSDPQERASATRERGSPLGSNRLATEALSLRTRALATLHDRFWLPDQRMYAFALLEQDQVRPELTAWPSAALGFGLLDEERGFSAAAAQARSAINTDWGTRSLASVSALFDPLHYSNGTVWPFTTGLTALGQYRYRNPTAGYQGLTSIVESGFVAGLGRNPEVFSGTTNEPLATAVPQQFFGTSFIPTVLVRGLLGWEPDAPHRTIRFSPQLPPEWDRLQVHQAPAGDTRYEISIRKARDLLDVTVSRAGRSGRAEPDTLVFVPHLPLGARLTDSRLKGGVSLMSEAPRLTARDQELTFRVVLTDSVEFTLQFEPGYDVVLPVVTPARGDRSRGLRLLDKRLEPDALVLTLEGPAGTTDTLSVLHKERNRVPVAFAAPGDAVDGYSQTVLRIPIVDLH